MRDGTFQQNFSPNSTLNNDFEEGDAYQYSWMVPYDVADLFTAFGGKPAALDRLNTFFTELNGSWTSNYAALWNEPSLEVPWEFDFTGAPWRTQSVVRQAITQLYSTNADGIPNNDDLGELSSWVVFGDLGFYPLYPGEGNLVLGSPLFPDTSITLGNGKTIHLTAAGAADDAPYVQSLQVNGQASTPLWQPYSTLSTGATLAFTLGKNPNTAWGSQATDAPPSYTPQSDANGYNTIGASSDNAVTTADYDGIGNSYSQQALAQAGISPGQPVMYNGVTFTWPNAAPGKLDAIRAVGQTLTLPANTQGTLAFLGSATSGPTSGTARITYTDHSQQTFTLGFSDWTASQPAFNNRVVATMPYRNGVGGKDPTGVAIFYADVALQPGKTAQSVTLSNIVDKGSLHIFAVSGKATAATVVDDTDSRISYTNMTGYSNVGSVYYNGTVHASNQANASFSYQCANCTEILWRATHNNDQGIADVYVDGTKVATVNDYVGGGTRQATSVVFGTGVLTPGQHTLKVVVTGTHDANATDSWVECDAIQFV